MPKKKKRLPKDVVVIEIGGYSLRIDQVKKRVAKEIEVGRRLSLIQVGTINAFKAIRPVFAYNMRGKDLKLIGLGDHPVLIRRWLYEYEKKEQKIKMAGTGVGNLKKAELRHACNVMLDALGSDAVVGDDVNANLQTQVRELREKLIVRYPQMKNEQLIRWSSLRNCESGEVMGKIIELGYFIQKETESV